MELNPFSVLEERLAAIESLIRESLSRTNPVVPATNDLIRIPEAARILGLKEQTIYCKVSRGEIPHMKVGRQVWFSLSEINDWIKSKKVRTNDEVEQDAEKHLKKLQRK